MLVPNSWFRISVLTLELALVLACDKREPSESTQGVEGPQGAPAWLSALNVKINGNRTVFEGNTEVLLSLENASTTTIVIHHLDLADAAVLRRTGDVVSKVHRLSVGVAKPLALAAGEKKDASFLFQAGPGGPIALQIYGKEWSL